MSRNWIWAVVLTAGLVALSPGSVQANPAQPAEDVPHGPSKEELASIGCLATGSAAAAAVGAFGLVALTATGGAAATYANAALPMMGAAFAAGCSVGALVAPGASWLIEHYVLGIHRETN